MLRMMIAAALCLVAVPLSGCACAEIDQCRGAETRCAAYVTAITATEAYALTGRLMSQSVVLGRKAAVPAIAILDACCPRSAA
ncbi:MAG: hypothetical protein EOP64_11835 [Sphingomonas sp.]|nr:MAG: hypothetical protein EOP64_11835 [Sphingomonas sp.]